MNSESINLKRRELVKALMAVGISGPLLSSIVQAAGKDIITKPIPSSGEQLPVIGVGSSRTFDALGDDELMPRLQKVLQAFFDHNGMLIDSSPMYGTAEAVIGQLLKQTNTNNQLFSATKVWIDGKQDGIDQMEDSRKLWGIKRFDLMQIHNLVDWRTHLDTINEMKADGRLRYTGITTSHGRDHDELEAVLKKHAFDFVQMSYNIDNRIVEDRLLPIARDRGIAVIINRAYQKGSLFRRVKGKTLPDWAGEVGIKSWGQFFLKYVVSHPAVTCAIPATTKIKHMVDNMGAQTGKLPDQKMRQEMIRYFQSVS
jgi:diketogulonate reductase-like aldo/keto reductase